MEKLMSISKKLDTFFKVMQKVVIIGMAVAVLVTAVLTVANAVNPNAVIGEDFHIVDIGPLTIELAPELAPDNATILAYVWVVLLLGAVSAALVYYAFGLIRRILRPMSQGQPFDADVSRSLRRMSYISLALGVVRNAGAMIETAAAVKAFDLAAIADGGAVQSITANYTFDLSFLVLFFVLILMSYIFRYGSELQQLSDETL